MGRDDLRAIHEYHVQQTVFADAKAGVLILIFSGVLGTLVANHLDQAAFVFNKSVDGQVLLLISSAGLLLFAIWLLIFIMVPRKTRRSGRQGVVYWGHIAEFPDSTSYLTRIKSLSAAASDEAWASNIHALGRVVAAKFRLMTWAVWVGVVGSALALLTFVAMEPGSPKEPASVVIVLRVDPHASSTGSNVPAEPMSRQK
jgi:hypothetical protein